MKDSVFASEYFHFQREKNYKIIKVSGGSIMGKFQTVFAFKVLLLPGKFNIPLTALGKCRFRFLSIGIFDI